MAIDYNDPKFHVTSRSAIPDVLSGDLNNNPAWAGWRQIRHSQPQLQFWLGVHKTFLKTIDQIEVVTRGLMDEAESDMGDGIRASNLLDGTQNLILSAQQHHSMEDQVFFPKFVTLNPRLKDPLEMLDHDHIVLDQSLDDTSAILDKLAVAKPSQDDVAALMVQSAQLNRMLSRHIHDEEEILMPEVLEIGLEKLFTA